MRSRILQKSCFFLQALIACDYVGFDVSVPIVQYLLPLILSFLDSKDDLIRGSCQDLVTRYNALIFTMVMSNPQIKVTPVIAAGYSDQLKEAFIIKCQVMTRLLMKKQSSVTLEDNIVGEEIRFWEDLEKFLRSSFGSSNVNNSSTSTSGNTRTPVSNTTSNETNDTTTTTISTEETPVLMLAPPKMTGAPNEP